MNIRFKLASLSALVAAVPAFADVKINENLSVSGYAVGALTTYDPDSGPKNNTSFDSGSSNFDAAKFSILGKFEAVSGKASLFYVPNTESDNGSAGILDAFATYTVGSVAVTGGKYLSYLGYEAFDPVNMTQLTYATTIGAIPAYHTGAKIDYTGDGFTLGFSATDSLFPGSGFFQGDGEFSDDLGYELIATYTGVKGLTVFVGFGYDNTDGVPGKDQVFDLWVSYAVTDKLTIAGEYDRLEDAFQAWLGLVQYDFGSGFSGVLRVSSKDLDNGGMGTQLTAAPTYKISDNFSVRGEVSYLDSAAVGGKGMFYGAQVVFKF